MQELFLYTQKFNKSGKNIVEYRDYVNYIANIIYKNIDIDIFT